MYSPTNNCNVCFSGQAEEQVQHCGLEEERKWIPVNTGLVQCKIVEGQGRFHV
jgi:hypothetical protein